MNIIAHVEIPVTDIDRAIAFYSDVFRVGFGKIVEIHGNRMAYFPFEEGKEGASCALAEGEVYVPTVNGSIIYFSVTDIDAVIARATAIGSDLLFPKTALPDGGFVAEILDSEGNRIAIQQLKA
ncbi:MULTISPECIES: VOC family protein [Brucella]|uniref:VOC family protein n=1 Tax=Brucella pituitosa TaxID=571256 RepID=A0A643F9F5_9HYPH|nr:MULTISPECIES: VOC family protein [Brucella]PQZ49470.1 VOC family protein [Ochrobactrum sp. MYb19]PRA57308.1 VOC family protein [Ochrobactrum sp. MYb68]PRA66712.1 VOC family protein [Ochrobactrum sp. MYb18]PRA76259.1 VOC family protein [Brucella thiophenivorans]PRA91722.1 VOC family protein [Ochrobactrum sp. MYb14]PRA98265.1 VOC family protein [Ochrobactrum sp. MYb15]